VALDQLDGQTRFTDTTATDNDELVLSKELYLNVSMMTDAGRCLNNPKACAVETVLFSHRTFVFAAIVN
jgi:hypothetical protein